MDPGLASIREFRVESGCSHHIECSLRACSGPCSRAGRNECKEEMDEDTASSLASKKIGEGLT